MPIRRDLTGSMFGRWRVIGEKVARRAGLRAWLCACECGSHARLVLESQLISSKSRSCGCGWFGRSAQAGPRRCGTPTHNSWRAMMGRCYQPTYANYPRYGGAGITVCERWHSFENFLADMGERPDGTSLDRKDSAGNYDLQNCRWATKIEQLSNRRKAVHPLHLPPAVIAKIGIDGRKARIIAAEYGVHISTVGRIRGAAKRALVIAGGAR